MTNKIDSNFTGLRYAEEATIGVLPGSPAWKPLEPNSYSDFGAQITTLARTPIQASRQRKKGVTTDLSASGGFQTDFTQTNLYDLLQGFFFAGWREQGVQAPTAVDGSGEGYTVADSAGFFPGNILLASGFGTAANNGVKHCTAVTSGAVTVSEDLTTEGSPPAAASVKAVGFKFGSGDLAVTSVLGVISLVNGALAAGVSALTISSTNNAVADETVTIGSKTYTFKASVTTVANQVKIGADKDATITNLANAINGGAGSGTTYGSLTVPSTEVSAVNSGSGVLTATGLVPGARNSLIVTTETMTNGSWNHAALTGGDSASFLDMGLVPGQWIFVGGDTSGERFATSADRGFARLATVTDDTVTLDKTAATFTADAGSGQTVSLFFPDVIKNEADPALIVRRSYQLERSLSDAGYEYLVGAVPNTLAITLATANKVTADVTFVGTDGEQVDSGSRKSGTFPALVESDAFNTSSDFARLRLATKDTPATPLFAFFQDLTITINNNVTPDKAVAQLGAFDMTAGDFQLDGSMTAYFADVAALEAVRDNDDVSLDFTLVKNNAGWAFDLPLVALGDGRLNVTKDKPIAIPLTLAAAADQTFDHTLLACRFSYLPDLAA